MPPGRGRGRGAGRGRGPLSVASQFLRRSAEESGLDSRNLRSLQQQHNKGLYSDILLHSSGEKRKISEEDENKDPKKKQQINVEKRNPSTIYMITKSREIHYRIQNSSFNLKSESNIPDVKRHSNMNEEKSKKKSILHDCFQDGKINTNLGSFFPEELVLGATSLKKRQVSASNNEEIALIEGDEKFENFEKKIDNEGEVNIEEEEYEGEEEEGEDYVMDYYASENEESDGNDEPIYEV